MITGQLIKNLATLSIDPNGEVNKKVASYALDKLNKKELKVFLRRLKKVNSEKTVIVKYEGNLTTKLKKTIEDMFEDKKISFERDKKLGGGIMIIDNDMVVNYTIEGIIDNKVKII